jgi:hypothetical protein
MSALGSRDQQGWYPPWRRGWEEIGGQRCFFRSSWEANYARYLQWLKDADEIADWAHEPETLWLGTTGYIPDFRVTETDGTKTYHEVKGYMDHRSRQKLSLLKHRYPRVKLCLVTQAEYRAIERQYFGVIEGWRNQRGAVSKAIGRPSKRSMRCRVDKSLEQLHQALAGLGYLFADIDLRVSARTEMLRGEIDALEDAIREGLA